MSRIGDAIGDELRALPRRMGGASGVLIWLFGVGVLGVLLPWQLGFGFLDARVLLAYAMAPLLFVAPVVAESFSGERERNAVPADPGIRRDVLLGKVAAGAIHGWGSALVIMAAAFVTVNARYGAESLLLPPGAVCLDLAFLALLAALLFASLAAAVAVRARDARSAKRSLRQGFLLLLVAVIWYARAAPDAWRHATAGLLAPSTLTRLVLVAALIALPVVAGLTRLALAAWDRSEIHLDL